MSGGLILDALKAKANALAEEVKAQNDGLTIMYAVHHQNQLENTLHIMEDLILQHPAGHMARSILKRKRSPLEPSTFMGLSASQSRSWLGLQQSTSMLAIISINVDQYENFDHALYDLYHQTWHGIEIAELCLRPEMLERLQIKPMIPKRNPLSEAKANLRGDVFTALMLAAEGYDDAIERLAKHRAKQVLERVPQAKPENYPFILASEAAAYAYHDVFYTFDADTPRIERCRNITTGISDSTTDDQIRQWWRFCEPAQDMAWRGYDQSAILGAALHTCEDPYVRAIAHQMVNMTGIVPLRLEKLQTEYNPFVRLHINTESHLTMVEETFQVVLAQGIEQESGKPFLAAANTQNRDLTQGRFMGWCAMALQAAGKAFESARKSGKIPEQAAHLEFESYRESTPIDGLERMCKDIIRKQRDGEIVTLDQIPVLAREIGNMETIIESVTQTLEDPGYRQTLDTVYELTRTFEPAGPGSALALQLAPSLNVPHPAQATPTVLDFSPDGLSLPPLTTRKMPENRGETAAQHPAPRLHTAHSLSLPTLPSGDLSLELAFSEADETPSAAIEKK